MSYLNEPQFKDEKAAFEFVEAHLWKDGRACPHCGVLDQSGALKGASTRVGLYKCYACRKPFTVRIGTIFESSHVKLHLWLQAIYLMVSSKKGISANQLHRTLGITLKSAWFLSHRIREAMRDTNLPLLLGTVEADETYMGKVDNPGTTRTDGKPFTKQGKSGPSNKRAIVSLVERGGSVRSFHVDRADQSTVASIVRTNIQREAWLYTDESPLYKSVGREFTDHQTVKHSHREYARGDIHTNSVEGFFSIFKRGMKGVYQHCREKHLHRYLAEFDFRYNARERLGVNDQGRAVKAVLGVAGKRLTYRQATKAKAKPVI